MKEFGSGSDGAKILGLESGQKRSDALVQNAGWYNGNGQTLGFGDLDAGDIQKISRAVAEDDCFIVLTEADWLMNAVGNKKDGSIESILSNSDKAAVLKKAWLIIAKDQLYIVDNFGNYGASLVEIQGLRFTVVKKALEATILIRDRVIREQCHRY